MASYAKALTVYEYTRVISERASQIERNSPPRIDAGTIDPNASPVDIAIAEWDSGLYPGFVIERIVHAGRSFNVVVGDIAHRSEWSEKYL